MELQVLKGGIDPSRFEDYHFIGAFVINTRLMGVLGLFVEWGLKMDGNDYVATLGQIYYYDIEEFGLESLKIIQPEPNATARELLKSFGGLGGKNVELNEKETRFLIKYFVEETKKKNQPLPQEVKYLDFILKRSCVLSKKAEDRLWKKTCVEIKSDNGVANYYLMRCFARDESGMLLLRDKDSKPSDFDDICMKKPSSFLQNRISRKYEEGICICRCESFIESENEYYIINSELFIREHKVLSAKKVSELHISVEEASLLSDRPEYILSCKITEDLDSFRDSFEDFFASATKTEHDSGDIYMVFKTDNDHVENDVFVISDDVQSTFYISDDGELIVASYSEDLAVCAEYLLNKGGLDKNLCKQQHIKFSHGMLYDFILSGVPSFSDFVSLLE